MATINVYDYLIGTINGKRYEFGSLTTPRAYTVTLAFEQVYSVSTETTVTLFDVDTDLADFDLLLIASDYDVMLELSTDNDDDVGDENYTIECLGSGTAGTYGSPVRLFSDDSYANYTVNFAAGTLDVIERIRARNLSATTTATVLVMAFT